jgi:uncharacterized membrane protein YfcA
VTFGEVAAILVAGIAAGTINTVVGSGTLITFPTLLAFGYPPVTANISNAIGLVPGSISGAIGYREELAGQGRRVRRLAVGTFLGAVLGAVLLLVLPPGAFRAVVPVLILLSVLLVLFQPWISRWVAQRHEHLGGLPENGTWFVRPGVFATGVYCGYFGAAQGVLMMAILGIGMDDSLQRLNGIKNVLAALGNGVAGAVFVIAAFGQVDWLVAALLAVGSTIGGQIGAHWGRRLPPAALRGLIAAVGTVALVSLLR